MEFNEHARQKLAAIIGGVKQKPQKEASPSLNRNDAKSIVVEGVQEALGDLDHDQLGQMMGQALSKALNPKQDGAFSNPFPAPEGQMAGLTRVSEPVSLNKPVPAEPAVAAATPAMGMPSRGTTRTIPNPAWEQSQAEIRKVLGAAADPAMGYQDFLRSPGYQEPKWWQKALMGAAASYGSGNPFVGPEAVEQFRQGRYGQYLHNRNTGNTDMMRRADILSRIAPHAQELVEVTDPQGNKSTLNPNTGASSVIYQNVAHPEGKNMMPLDIDLAAHIKNGNPRAKTIVGTQGGRTVIPANTLTTQQFTALTKYLEGKSPSTWQEAEIQATMAGNMEAAAFARQSAERFKTRTPYGDFSSGFEDKSDAAKNWNELMFEQKRKLNAETQGRIDARQDKSITAADERAKKTQEGQDRRQKERINSKKPKKPTKNYKSAADVIADTTPQ